jgi:hypothetical protein
VFDTIWREGVIWITDHLDSVRSIGFQGTPHGGANGTGNAKLNGLRVSQRPRNDALNGEVVFEITSGSHEVGHRNRPHARA